MAELNRAIFPLLHQLNRKDYQKREGSRYQRYIEDELPYLKPLPSQVYQNELWDTVRIPKDDYYACIDGSYYSVPNQLRGKMIEYAKSNDSIRFYFEKELVAVHALSSRKGKVSIIEDHATENHRAMHITNEKIMKWASQYGEQTQFYCQAYLDKFTNNNIRYRFFNKFKKLICDCSKTEIEHICQVALEGKYFYIKDIRRIFNNLNKIKLKSNMNNPPIAQVFNEHDNLRGREYYLKQAENESEMLESEYVA